VSHRDKIRKKVRTAAGDDARRGLRAELRVARLLLADQRIDLAFEARGALKGGPDFSVSFRGAPAFNLEVTAQQRDAAPSHGGPLLAKLRQLPPSAPNVVLIALDPRAHFDVSAATSALRDRADAGDDVFFSSRGYDGPRGFYQRYLRLGAVLVWRETAPGNATVTRWDNASTRIPVPERALRAVLACLAPPPNSA
jgi:hypothetical protein